MPRRRTIPFALAISNLFLLAAADKTPQPIRMQNDLVEVTATLVTGREDVKARLGVDAGVDIYIVDLKLRPRGDASVPVSRDQFTLISRKDGQKTQAMHPSQIAGSSALVVNAGEHRSGGGMLGGGRRGPIWGGVPGTGDRPRRVGGDDDGVIGTSSASKTEASIQNKGESDNPVLAALKQKELPQQPKATDESAGLLYFILEGKHKLKELELIYKAPGGNLILDFQK